MTELSKHIETLLLDNDCVIIPEFGGFVAHHISAEYDEESGLFYPPQRSVGFNPQLILNDSLLVQSYIETYDISYPEAARRIEKETEEIRQTLMIDGEYDFHGIGTLTLSAKGKYSFEPCTAGLLTPSLYALNSYGIEKIKKAQLVNLVPEHGHSFKIKGKTVRITYTGIRNAAVVAAMLFLVAFATIPVSMTNNGINNASVLNTTALSSMVSNLKNTTGDAADKTAKAKPEKKQETGRYTIVMASYVTEKGANNLVDEMKQSGHKTIKVYEKNDVRRVIYGAYATEDKAKEALKGIQTETSSFGDAWIGEIEKL